MVNSAFGFEESSNYGEVHDRCSSSSNGFKSLEGGSMSKQITFDGSEDWGELDGIDALCPNLGSYQNNSTEVGCFFSQSQQLEEQQLSCSDDGLFDDLMCAAVSPPIQTCLEEISKHGGLGFPIILPDAELQKEKQYPSLAALEILKNYGSFKRLNRDLIVQPSSNYIAGTKLADWKLSTEEIMRVAGAKFIQSSSEAADFSMLSHPYDLYFSGLSEEETKCVELAEFLLASAEKVHDQQYDSASKLLDQCDYLSSNTGNPIERLVYYFSEALREKIDRETGRVPLKGLGKQQSVDLDVAMMTPSPTSIAAHQRMPFCQGAQFCGIQAIIENVSDAKKVHVIDLEIRSGVQWIILMQALAGRYEFPLELLKITAVGTTSKHVIEKTGKRLGDFAKTMKLSFSFNIVMVPDMLDLKEDLFELEDEEARAVYAEFLLRTMIPHPNRLESVMTVIRNINARVMVVSEVEASHNSPVFVNRFIEALFFFSAYFDCLEACMKRDDSDRMILESIYLGQGIRNIVAAEGAERNVRHVKIDVWRAFFARYRLVETELSSSALYQAHLVVKNFSRGNSCTLDMDGKCLVIGWKGTPIFSLSVWKFLGNLAFV